MAVMGGPNSNFEKLFRSSVTGLSKSLDFRTKRITSILTKAYSNPQVSARYWNNVRRQLNVQYRAMDRLYSTWSKKNIPLAYKASVRELMNRLNRSKSIARRAKRSFMDIVTSPKSIQIQSILVKDAITDWVSSLTLGQSNVNRLTRRTQQTLLAESLIDSSVVKAVSSGNLMNNTFIKSLNMADTLAAQLDELAVVIDGEKYVIAGSRRFKPKYYAEMVTRVKFHEAQAQGAIMTAGNYGTSLVQVSSHNTTTEICQQYEGMIFSISGKDKRFPVLQAVPPYHVNCLHLLFPMFESAMEADGTLKQWQDFSHGKTDKPPSPANFVPVDGRPDKPIDAKAFNKKRRKERKAV